MAKELSALTGYPLFHNHLVADLASSIFPLGTKEYAALSEAVRLSTIRAAARSSVPGMIVTFAYGVETLGGKDDDALLKRMSRIVKSAGGKTYFVKFSASDAALRKRITATARKTFKKLRSYRALQKLRVRYRMDASVPFAKSIVINTTSITPKSAARMIMRAVRL